MARARAGRTVKVSVSLNREDYATLKRAANASHHGNLSAAFADAARWIRQREARRRLIGLLGGPTLTPDRTARLDAELGIERARPAKHRRNKSAA